MLHLSESWVGMGALCCDYDCRGSGCEEGVHNMI